MKVLVQSSCVMGIDVIKSTMEIKMAGVKCSAMECFEEKVWAGYFSATLLYRNL